MELICKRKIADISLDLLNIIFSSSFFIYEKKSPVNKSLYINHYVTFQFCPLVEEEAACCSGEHNKKYS
jgi:hypothetical protein